MWVRCFSVICIIVASLTTISFRGLMNSKLNTMYVCEYCKEYLLHCGIEWMEFFEAKFSVCGGCLAVNVGLKAESLVNYLPDY